MCNCMDADDHTVRIPCEHVQTITLAWGSSRGIWKYVQMCQLLNTLSPCLNTYAVLREGKVGTSIHFSWQFDSFR